MRALLRVSGAAGRIVLNLAIWAENSPAMRPIQVMDGMPISACTQSRVSREHSAEIGCVVRPFNSESHRAMSQVYLHACKCNCTSFYAYLFTSARSSHKRHLADSIYWYCSVLIQFCLHYDWYNPTEYNPIWSRKVQGLCVGRNGWENLVSFP